MLGEETKPLFSFEDIPISCINTVMVHLLK